MFVYSTCEHLRHNLTYFLLFFSGKPEGADGEEMETSSHMDTQVHKYNDSIRP